MFDSRVDRAIGAAMALSAVLAVSACTSPEDESSSTGVTTLVGSITGTIIDTNGAPIEGATVRYTGASSGEVTAVSNSAGQFELPDVGVVSVASLDPNDADGPITLLVESPESGTRTMGATVQVGPIAQITAVSGSSTFVDGFVVDTGPIRLPRLDATVTGILRNAATGVALTDTLVTLDFQGVEFDQDGTTGVAATYNSEGNLLVTSDSTGRFSFAEVYSDSCVRMFVSGQSIDSITGALFQCELTSADIGGGARSFATTIDGGVTELANVYVVPFETGDVIAPMVQSVDGVVDNRQNPAPLYSTVTGVSPNGFVVHFTEPMQALVSVDDITVLVGTDGAEVDVAAVSQPTTTTLEVSLSAPLPGASPVALGLARGALYDEAGNALDLNPLIAYDAFGGDADSRLLLLMYTDASVGTATATTSR